MPVVAAPTRPWSGSRPRRRRCSVAICVKSPLWATRPKKVTVRDALSVSLAVAESVTAVAVPVAASAGALSATVGGAFVPLPPPPSGAPAVHVGVADERARGAARDARAGGRAGALVEAVAADQAGAGRQLLVLAAWIWALRARDVPDAHLVDGALEEAGRGAVARERAADGGVLDAGGLRREVAAERERAVEHAVEVQAARCRSSCRRRRRRGARRCWSRRSCRVTGWFVPFAVSSKSATSVPVDASMPRK